MNVVEVSKIDLNFLLFEGESYFHVYFWLPRQKNQVVFQYRQCRLCKGGTASQRTEDTCVLNCKCFNFIFLHKTV